MVKPKKNTAHAALDNIANTMKINDYEREFQLHKEYINKQIILFSQLHGRQLEASKLQILTNDEFAALFKAFKASYKTAESKLGVTVDEMIKDVHKLNSFKSFIVQNKDTSASQDSKLIKFIDSIIISNNQDQKDNNFKGINLKDLISDTKTAATYTEFKNLLEVTHAHSEVLQDIYKPWEHKPHQVVKCVAEIKCLNYLKDRVYTEIGKTSALLDVVTKNPFAMLAAEKEIFENSYGKLYEHEDQAPALNVIKSLSDYKVAGNVDTAATIQEANGVLGVLSKGVEWANEWAKSFVQATPKKEEAQPPINTPQQKAEEVADSSKEKLIMLGSEEHLEMSKQANSVALHYLYGSGAVKTLEALQPFAIAYQLCKYHAVTQNLPSAVCGNYYKTLKLGVDAIETILFPYESAIQRFADTQKSMIAELTGSLSNDGKIKILGVEIDASIVSSVTDFDTTLALEGSNPYKLLPSSSDDKLPGAIDNQVHNNEL
jgi:hypothetical protein